MSSPARRIRDARERAGLELADVADAVGFNLESYRDVEDFDDEVTSNISIHELAKIAALIGLSPLTILEGSAAVPPAPISCADVAERVRARISTLGLSVDAYGDKVGWDVAEILDNPAALGGFTVDGVQDVCGDIGIDWRGVLAAAAG